jgi:hypothetical protein
MDAPCGPPPGALDSLATGQVTGAGIAMDFAVNQISAGAAAPLTVERWAALRWHWRQLPAGAVLVPCALHHYPGHYPGHQAHERRNEERYDQSLITDDDSVHQPSLREHPNGHRDDRRTRQRPGLRPARTTHLLSPGQPGGKVGGDRGLSRPATSHLRALTS